MTAFLSREHCEAAAGRLLIRYQHQIGERLSLPVDVDIIGELIVHLRNRRRDVWPPPQ